jgi:hypothetical protein
VESGIGREGLGAQEDRIGEGDAGAGDDNWEVEAEVGALAERGVKAPADFSDGGDGGGIGGTGGRGLGSAGGQRDDGDEGSEGRREGKREANQHGHPDR